jgi:hypothetical protein
VIDHTMAQATTLRNAVPMASGWSRAALAVSQVQLIPKPKSRSGLMVVVTDWPNDPGERQLFARWQAAAAYKRLRAFRLAPRRIGLPESISFPRSSTCSRYAAPSRGCQSK